MYYLQKMLAKVYVSHPGTAGEELLDIGIAVLILAAFWLLRKRLSRLVLGLVSTIANRTKTRLDNHIAKAFEKPMHWFFALLGLYLALWYLPLTGASNALVSDLFRSAIILIVTAGLYSLASSSEALHEEFEELFSVKVDKILVPFFSKVLKFIIVALALTMIAQEWDYRIDGVIAGLGLGGLAFSLAAKDALANIFGGLVIILDKPFSIGDWIMTPSVEGTVEDINFRGTKVRTFAQALVTVPNSTLASEPITNWTKMGKRRITFKLGVPYGTPRAKLKKCVEEIEKMLRQHPDIHQETILVRFDSFGESSLDMFLYFFTQTTNWEEHLRVKEDVNLRIMEILEREEVSLAFPSKSIYFETPLQTHITSLPSAPENKS